MKTIAKIGVKLPEEVEVKVVEESARRINKGDKHFFKECPQFKGGK